MSPRDVRANASGLSYAILATRWLKRSRQAAWDEIYDQWDRRLPPAPEIEPFRYGAFDPGDSFQLLADNAEAFATRYRLFEEARESIDITTYYIQADATGQETARRLAQCARRGVRVRILVDGIATARKAYEDAAVDQLAAGLRSAGAEFRVFRDPARPFDASHRKLLLVDETTLITGGRNYADHYSGREWRDIDLMLTGPSARQAQAVVEQTFAQASGYAAKPGSASSGMVQTTTPAGIAENAGFIYLLQCIRACRKTLDIEHAYYMNHSIVHRELAHARRRGVRVRLLTNSAISNDLDFTNYRIYAGFPDLLDAGIELHVQVGKGRTLHCKYFVADGEWVGLGSSNLDFYSPRFCGEAGIHVRSAGLGSLLASWFEEGLRDAERVVSANEVAAFLRAQTIGRVFDSRFHDIQ